MATRGERGIPSECFESHADGVSTEFDGPTLFPIFSKFFPMSHINRAIVQVPVFLVIAGIGVWWNWRPITLPTPQKTELPLAAAEAVIEHAEEEILRIRAELDAIRSQAEYSRGALPAYPEDPMTANHSTPESTAASTIR